MLKIGIIGLGDIATKAYLPVITKHDVEIHLHTRNREKLEGISNMYRLGYTHESLDSFISSGITAAFVHTTTSSHEAIIEQLLINNIDVYVDKPVTYNFDSSERLIALAEKQRRILMVGFNRRFAPAYAALKNLPDISMIILQKNRSSQPGNIRTFIFDDFIHVVDTLLHLFPYAISGISVNGKKDNDTLYHVTVQLVAASGAVAMGIMNRDAGTVEERLEVFTPRGKRIVEDVAHTYIHENKNVTRLSSDDWQTTLHKRGFEQIIDTFLTTVSASPRIVQPKDHTLLTHSICEEIVTQLHKTEL
ncbi:MAG: Gfo/Idh/MocA family oxidoreductase [Chryseolinea sp.]